MRFDEPKKRQPEKTESRKKKSVDDSAMVVSALHKLHSTNIYNKEGTNNEMSDDDTGTQKVTGVIFYLSFTKYIHINYKHMYISIYTVCK